MNEEVDVSLARAVQSPPSQKREQLSRSIIILLYVRNKPLPVAGIHRGSLQVLTSRLPSSFYHPSLLFGSIVWGREGLLRFADDGWKQNLAHASTFRKCVST
jgi:hypothetical protein